MFDLAMRIVRAECLLHGIPVGLVRSRSRIRNAVEVRKIIVRRLRAETDLSWGAIGYVLKRGASFRGAQRPLPGVKHTLHSLTTVRTAQLVKTQGREFKTVPFPTRVVT